MRWLTLVLALLGAAGCTPADVGGGSQPAGSTKSDTEAPELIVLISLDTLRADHLGAYGYERFTSPVLDMIAAEGVLFEDAAAGLPRRSSR